MVTDGRGCEARLLELLLESAETAEGALDFLPESSLGRRMPTRRHPLPEQRVVEMSPAVIADLGADPFGHLIEVGQQRLEREPLQRLLALERRIQIGDISLVVFAVMDPHRGLVDVWLQGVVVEWQGSKGEGHGVTPFERGDQTSALI